MFAHQKYFKFLFSPKEVLARIIFKSTLQKLSAVSSFQTASFPQLAHEINSQPRPRKLFRTSASGKFFAPTKINLDRSKHFLREEVGWRQTIFRSRKFSLPPTFSHAKLFQLHTEKQTSNVSIFRYFVGERLSRVKVFSWFRQKYRKFELFLRWIIRVRIVYDQKFLGAGGEIIQIYYSCDEQNFQTKYLNASKTCPEKYWNRSKNFPRETSRNGW